MRSMFFVQAQSRSKKGEIITVRKATKNYKKRKQYKKKERKKETKMHENEIKVSRT